MKEIVMRYNFSLLFSTRKTYNPSRPLPTLNKLMKKKIVPQQNKKAKTFPEKFVNYKEMNKESISCTNRDFTTTITPLPVLLLSILSSFCQLTRFLYIGFCEKTT